MQRILLVDDDVNFRRSLTIQLELEGYTVICRENGEDALSMLKRNVSPEAMPQVVISDVRMTNMGGEEFISMLKCICPRIPVLVISAFDPPESLDFYPYLRKPFKIHEMINAIDGLVAQA
ncbi:response regulator [bacterium]|nr:response regulator [bacterium]